MLANRKEKIAIKALELFATNGFHDVSISDLQYDLDMGRGTMYYYFKNKEDLFHYVMIQYFIIPKQTCLQVSETVTIPEMIETLLSYLHSLELLLDKFTNKNINTANVVMMMFTAYNYFPDLHRKAYRLHQKELILWQRAIHNSIRLGDIRDDIPIETIATMFTNIKDGYDTGKVNIMMDFTILAKQYYSLYELLKK